MALVSLKPIIDAALDYGYGQGAFNVNAVAQAKAVIEVHEMFRAPAVLQGADLANGFMGGCVDFKNADDTEAVIRSRGDEGAGKAVTLKGFLSGQSWNGRKYLQLQVTGAR